MKRNLILIAALTTTLHAQSLPAILSQLDTAAKTFKSAQATVQTDNYTRVVRDHTLDTGTLYIERNGPTVTMGAITYDLGPDGKPAKSPSKIVTFDGAILQMFTPGTNQADVFKAGANQAKYESFLTLGFGGSGSDLAKNWNINDQGSETINNVKTEKLDLISKDPSVSSTFTHVTIWVDPTRGISLKQIFYAPNGDTRTALYTNIKLNTRIDKKPYSIPSTANRINH
jgi:outer membrane lipoprotein-sorting protein